MSAEIRYRLEHKPLTYRQRIRIWWNGIKRAVLEAPPKTRCNYVELKPGDAGYEHATFRAEVVKSPRYVVKDGKWEQVDPTNEYHLPNPAYYSP